MIKLKSFCVIAMSTILLQGCVTSSLNSTTTNSKRIMENDNIRYMVNYVLPNGQRDTSKLIILGDKYTYVIEDGETWYGTKISELEQLAQTFELQYFKAEPIYIEIIPMIAHINYHQPMLKFDYDKKGKLLTEQEKKLLEHHCYHTSPTAYTGCQMQFVMRMYQKYTPTNTNLQAVKGNYSIQLATLKDDTTKRALLKPFAILADIVTSPLQLAGGAIFFGSLAIGCASGNCNN